MTGWISLHRKVRDHWLFEEKRSFSKFEAWVDLLMEVNHQDNKVLLGNELIEVKRGQKVTSMEQLALRWGWSKDKTYKFVKLLESEQMIERKSNTKRTVLTIVNYDIYQLSEVPKHTPNEHKNYANSTPTDTNNNVNNVNNVNKVSSSNSPEQVWENLRLGNITPQLGLNINGWIDDGFSEDIIIKAMQITADAGKHSWNYTNGILVNWYKAGCRSLAEVETYQEQEKRKREERINGRSSNNNRANSTGLSTIEEQERFIEENRLPFIKR
ncbi:DnaD domain protein [Arthrobacter citreus]|nr:DnaD domain protein [Arthrobacter citreus]